MPDFQFDPSERTSVQLRVLFAPVESVPEDLAGLAVPVRDRSGRLVGYDLSLQALVSSDRPQLATLFEKWRSSFEVVRPAGTPALWWRLCEFARTQGLDRVGDLARVPVSVDVSEVEAVAAEAATLRRRILVGPGGWVLVDTARKVTVRAAAPAAEEPLATGAGWHLVWDPYEGLIATVAEKASPIAGWELHPDGIVIFDVDDEPLDCPPGLLAAVGAMAPGSTEVAVAPAAPDKVFAGAVRALTDTVDAALGHRCPFRVLTDDLLGVVDGTR